MRKIKKIILIILLLSGSILYSATLVFPFRIKSSENKSIQWLGKAVSLYLNCGFKLNGIDTVRNEETDFMLKTYNIRFPFNVSKALLMKVSKELNADKLICGDIYYSVDPDKNSKKNIIVRPFFIDLKTYKQIYLPLIRGETNEIFKIEMELFKNVLRLYQDRGEIKFPEMEFEKSSYEKFVKAMLLSDFGSRLSLLKKISGERYGKSEIYNFEMAKSLFFTNSINEAKQYLKKIKPDSYMKGEKYYLEGVIDYFEGEKEKSLEDFKFVVSTGFFKHQALNNYGMLLGILHRYEEGIKALLNSIKIKSSKEAYINSIYIYILSKNSIKARKQLQNALIIYPYSEELLNIMKKFMKDFQLRSEVSTTFSKYIPGFDVNENDEKINFMLINPFIPNEVDEVAENDLGKKYNGSEEYLDPDINEFHRKIWKSPFYPDSYFKISEILIRNKKYYSALEYASCSLFLRNNLKDYINVLSLLKRLGRESDFKIILKQALTNFPEYSEISSLK